MNTLNTLEIQAFANGIGLRFDGFQDPCGAAEATGESKYEMMAFTCIRDGAAKGTTFYMPFGASLEQIADRWNMKLAEIFAAEYQLLKGQLIIAKASLDKIASWSEGPEVNSFFDEPCAASEARRALKRMT